MSPINRLPFILHLATETAASISFLFYPHKQLPAHEPPSPETMLILRNLGGSLLSSNLICLGFIFLPAADASEEKTHQLLARTGHLVAISLGVYHFFPIYRAAHRITTSSTTYRIGNAQRSDKRSAGRIGDSANSALFGGPAMHLVVHLICLVGLIGSGIAGLLST